MNPFFISYNHINKTFALFPNCNVLQYDSSIRIPLKKIL